MTFLSPLSSWLLKLPDITDNGRFMLETLKSETLGSSVKCVFEKHLKEDRSMALKRREANGRFYVRDVKVVYDVKAISRRL